jgi:histone arginine demethylase JMJD6
MPLLPTLIDRRAGLTPEEFQRQYYLTGRPVVMTDATKTWRANGVLTPQWIRDNYPDKEIDLGDVRYTMTRLWELLEKPEPGRPSPYPCTMPIDRDWPELRALLDPLPLPHARPNRLQNPLFFGHRFGSRTEIFMGGPGGDFPYAHIDYYHLHAWINMIYGRKEFWIFAAESAADMYPEPPDHWRSTIPNIFDPDYARFPLYRNVTVTRVELGPGETIYIPAGTWHTARSLTPTISIAFDQLNATNMAAFTRDVATYQERGRLKRLAYSNYFRVLGATVGLIERSSLPIPW